MLKRPFILSLLVVFRIGFGFLVLGISIFWVLTVLSINPVVRFPVFAATVLFFFVLSSYVVNGWFLLKRNRGALNWALRYDLLWICLLIIYTTFDYFSLNDFPISGNIITLVLTGIMLMFFASWICFRQKSSVKYFTEPGHRFFPVFVKSFAGLSFAALSLYIFSIFYFEKKVFEYYITSPIPPGVRISALRVTGLEDREVTLVVRAEMDLFRKWVKDYHPVTLCTLGPENHLRFDNRLQPVDPGVYRDLKKAGRFSCYQKDPRLPFAHAVWVPGTDTAYFYFME